jgi:hypothetical protein
MQIELVGVNEEGLLSWRAWRISNIVFLFLDVPDSDCRFLQY